eukprot:COSAG01_NODE_4003_length_5442_cov_6.778027_6_plen_289_part_00
MWYPQVLKATAAENEARAVADMSFCAAVLTEMYLCDAWSCQERLRRDGAVGSARSPRWSSSSGRPTHSARRRRIAGPPPTARHRLTIACRRMCRGRRFGFSTVTTPPRSLGLEYERLAAQQKAQKLVGELAKCKKVSRRPLPSWSRCISAEIELCHACSCHEMLRAEAAGQDAAIVSAQLALLRGRAGLTAPAASSEQQGGGAGAGGGGGRGLGARRAHSMDEILEQGREGSEGGRLSPRSTRQADPLFDHFYLTAQGLLVRYVTIRTGAVTGIPLQFCSSHLWCFLS